MFSVVVSLLEMDLARQGDGTEVKVKKERRKKHVYIQNIKTEETAEVQASIKIMNTFVRKLPFA